MTDFSNYGKTIVIGDLHLKNIPNQPGYLASQVECICNLVRKESEGNVDKTLDPNVVFLGDIFHNRKPSPTELLAFRSLLDRIVGWTDEVYLIRGNHESETKADDGVTALSLFRGNCVYDITHTETIGRFTFIPHYERQEIIEAALKVVPEGNIVFGHFGLAGALNSAGDSDFNLTKKDFKNPTFLGHVHHYKELGNVTIQGTPYTTSFQEAGKQSYYGVIDFGEEDNWTYRKEPVIGGPRHTILNYSKLEANKELLKDTTYYNILRVVMNELEVTADSKVRNSIMKEYGVDFVDIKFAPIQEDTKLQQSNFSTTEEVFQVTDDLIEKYVKENNTALPYDKIMQGLKELKNDV